MSKRKPIDKKQARERRNRLLESAASAQLSLTEGVREMRAIAGMTQEEFAQHRGVSARVIKAIELGQGNPTMATLNRIGEFFGLEVAFVPLQDRRQVPPQSQAADDAVERENNHGEVSDWALVLQANKAREDAAAGIRKLTEVLAQLDAQLANVIQRHATGKGMIDSLTEDTRPVIARTPAERKPRSR